MRGRAHPHLGVLLHCLRHGIIHRLIQYRNQTSIISTYRCINDYLPRLLDYIITTYPVYSITSLLPIPFTRLHHYYLPRLLDYIITTYPVWKHLLFDILIDYYTASRHQGTSVAAPALCTCTCALHHCIQAPGHLRDCSVLLVVATSYLKKSTSEDTLESMMMVHKNL